MFKEITNTLKLYQNTLNPHEVLCHSVGPLLYTPAVNSNISNHILNGEIHGTYSLALCLEDSISPESVNHGILSIIKHFEILWNHKDTIPFLPYIFIRVRTPEQIEQLYEELGASRSLLKGFIFPKFHPVSSTAFLKTLVKINSLSTKTFYCMPTLESRELVSPVNRIHILHELSKVFSSYKDLILNIRVGGNDLSNVLGIRRNLTENIYQVQSIASILGDIICTFSEEFVISGPVFEYFNDETDSWKNALTQEYKLDQLNGFVGKTVIHPHQIPIINHSMKVSLDDILDSFSILGDHTSPLQVSKNVSGQRMNEIPTHFNWAKKQLLLGSIYGVKNNEYSI